jgi:nondiscriminating glutamyl-tRNA synthetase
MIRTRFAPSPTGHLHIGNTRTALFNYLLARKERGAFVLRIEDTDLERSKPEFETEIIEGLHWLGMNWDEGPDVGGPYGPYRQSERLEIYEKYLRELSDQGHVYRCYCTLEELEQEKDSQIKAGQPPRYSGKCRELSSAQQKAREEEGCEFTLRFKIETRTAIGFDDLIRGHVEFHPDTLDDFIIAKDFTAPLYNFAVVIDDHLMQISHVFRGEEHLSNTPKQILIARALGLSSPVFAHMPLILNTDRAKLSKRHNKVGLVEYREDGYLPEALVNFMAFLGWNPGGDREIYSLHEIEDLFTSKDIHKSGAIFDTQKLEWFNSHYIRLKDILTLTDACIPYLIDGGFIRKEGDCYRAVDSGKIFSRQMIEKIVGLEKDRIKKLSEIREHTGYFFVAMLNYEWNLLAWKAMTSSEVRESLIWMRALILSYEESDLVDPIRIEEMIKGSIQSTGKKAGAVLWPFRVSMTGLAASPDPFTIASILGKDTVLERIDSAIERIPIQ